MLYQKWLNHATTYPLAYELKEKFYLLVGNLGQEGVAVRDVILTQLDGFITQMSNDVQNNA